MKTHSIALAGCLCSFALVACATNKQDTSIYTEPKSGMKVVIPEHWTMPEQSERYGELLLICNDPTSGSLVGFFVIDRVNPVTPEEEQNLKDMKSRLEKTTFKGRPCHRMKFDWENNMVNEAYLIVEDDLSIMFSLRYLPEHINAATNILTGISFP